MRNYIQLLLWIVFLYCASWTHTRWRRESVLVKVNSRLAKILFYIKSSEGISVVSIILGLSAHVSLIFFLALVCLHHEAAPYIKLIVRMWVWLGIVLIAAGETIEIFMKWKRAETKGKKVEFLLLTIILTFSTGIIVYYLLVVGGTEFVNQLSQNRTANIKAIQVGGLVASWEYVERDVDLDYFYQLDGTTTYEQIEEEIGKPNGGRGSGLVLPYYQVNGNQFIVMSFSLDEYGEYYKVGAIYLCNHTEVLEVIYPRGLSKGLAIVEYHNEQDFRELITYKYPFEEFANIREELKSGKDIDIFELVDLEKLECVRNIEGIRYVLLLSEKNERLFLFLNSDNVVTDTFYMENDFLEQEDFANVKEGVTLKSDMEILDESPVYYEVSAKMVTGHIVQEGIVIIEYDTFLNGKVLNDPVVKSISFYGNDEILSMMESNFFVSSTPYILPMDKQ